MKELRRLTLSLILSLVLLGGAVLAQPEPTEKTPAPAPAGQTDATPPAGAEKPGSGSPGNEADKKGSADQGGPEASIENICAGTASEIGSERKVHLGDWLTLNVKGIEKLGERAKGDKKPLQLFLNGLPLAGVPAIYYQPNGQEQGCLKELPGYPLVRFHLVRNEDSKETWSVLLGRPGRRDRDVQVSVGVAGCSEGCTDISTPKAIKLEVIRHAWLLGYCVVLILLLLSLLLLAYRTTLLRDRGKDSSWSLGRSQMAWWFFFVIAAFLYIWMVTGSYSSLSNSVLALIGISATTAVLGSVMDDTKETKIAQKPALETEKAKLETEAATLPTTAPAVQANSQRLQQVYAELAQMPEEQVTTHSFWTDILSDEDGISFHRYQIVIWTLVLTAIFIVDVHVSLAMPDFDGQLLALMGISSGTYLGFKFPEKKV